VDWERDVDLLKAKDVRRIARLKMLINEQKEDDRSHLVQYLEQVCVEEETSHLL
jgi:hypothetical protein